MSYQSEYTINKKLGIRAPRTILFPPYLLINPYFVDFMDAVDEVFADRVDAKIDILENIRNMWVTNSDVETTIMEDLLIDFEQWSQPERDILVKQTNMLGMSFQNAGVLTDDSYQQITRNVGVYWFEKGTQAFIEFINYCLKSDLTVVTLWTTDYLDFVPFEESGTPIWEGGPWYPTTHVQIVATGGLGSLDIRTLNAFFYEIANYNLVLYSIDERFYMPVVDTLEPPEHITADIVAIGIYGINEIVMSNLFTYGANPPTTVNILTPDTIPTRYYAMGGVPVDFSTSFVLAMPQSWITDEMDRKFPVYSEDDRTVREAPDLPTRLVGEPSSTGVYALLAGPVSWNRVEGSTRSQGRFPSYSTSAYTIINTNTYISTRQIGFLRQGLLSNPKGFLLVAPGQYAPYW